MAGSGVTDRVRWRDSGADLARALGTEGGHLARLLGPQPAGPARSQHALAWRLAWPVLIALALVGPGLAIWIYSARTDALRERRRTDADQALQRWANVLHDQTLAYAEALQAARWFFECSDVVRRDEFARFTSSMLERHPVLRLVAWAPAVPRSQRAVFEDSAAGSDAEPAGGFRIWNAADALPRMPSAADHFPILYAVPASIEKGLLGLDLRGDTLRARLLERALATEVPVISDPLQLAASDAPSSGVLMALRVASDEPGSRDGTPATPSTRGVLLLGFRVADLLTRTTAHLGSDRAALLRTVLFGRHGDAREVHLGGSLRTVGFLGARADGASDGDASLDDGASLDVEASVDVCGQRWRLRARPSAAFLDGGPQDSPGWVAAGALLGWEVLLAAVAALGVGWHATLMRRQSTLVDHVLQNLDEAVIVADRRGRVRMANAAALTILGVPLGDDGRPIWPERLLFGRSGTPGALPSAQPLERAIAGEDVPEATYTLQVPYSAAERDVAVSGHPVVDETGALHGGMLVIRDVTEELGLQKKAVAMELAGALQQRQFPTSPPPGLDLDLAGAVRAAEETSGDGYDWMLDPQGRLVLSVSDVRDHGLRAAMQMVSTRAYLRSQVAAGAAPDRVLAEVNANLVAELPPEDFVTLLCVEVDPATRRVRYANAGHPAGLLIGPHGELEARLEATGPLLGVMEHGRYRLAEAPPLLPGRTLVLLTDGVLECANRSGRRFEEGGLLEVVARHAHRGAGELVQAVLAAVREFAGEGPPQDDLTVVILKG